MHTCIAAANSPEIAIILLSEQFEKEHVSVLLEWSKMNGGVIFNVFTTPQVIGSFAHGPSTSYRLNVSYNTQYNVSIVATLCGQSHITITELNYGELRIVISIFCTTKALNLVKCFHMEW